ncbi:4Fe-4S binding protein [Planotetraspora sp. A-T 1434]|uniref:NuoI/complex I 23 kDa subunit family protein n=1 Tax=Planotetraspora sp. A-T 1434 TaxID=2979219 RepID=UPI0021BE696E|nr:4Fe-4S binding protein [Planotetraspora sp. A-T 1434]MCT9931955.1 4Fe-4S binding protein [Planotetraspora sp. A-T 1434]
MLRKSETQQYPEVHPDLPPRSRGVIALVEENCTVCMLCARECPDWCIYIDSHKETLPAPEGGRPRARNVLDRFAIDFSLCMYCGICIEVCPFDALFWSPEFEYSEYDIRDLIHEKDRLGEWAGTVPPPPPHEVGAEPPKELSAASRPARPARTAGPAQATPSQATPSQATPPQAGPSQASPSQAGPPQGASSQATPRSTTGSDQATPDETTPPQATPDAATAGAPPEEKAPRREPPRPMRDIRSIRPPGSLPRKPTTKDGPEEEA